MLLVKYIFLPEELHIFLNAFFHMKPFPFVLTVNDGMQRETERKKEKYNLTLCACSCSCIQFDWIGLSSFASVFVFFFFVPHEEHKILNEKNAFFCRKKIKDEILCYIMFHTIYSYCAQKYISIFFLFPKSS